MRTRLMTAVGAAVAFVALEAAVGWLWPVPLDPAPTWASVAGSALVLAVVFGAFAALAGARAWMVVVLWALVWGPEGARGAGWAVGWGVAPALFLLALGVWRSGRGWVWAFGALGALWTPLLRARPAALGAAPGTGPGVLWITVDTVRADAGLIDALPGQGWWRAEPAVSGAPWTLPSFDTMRTGLSVPEHGGGLWGAGGWSAAQGADWVDVLHDAGWQTVAVASNGHLQRAQGFNRGFDRWEQLSQARHPLVLWHNLQGQLARARQRPQPARMGADGRLVDEALRWVGGHQRLVWVHLMQVHDYRFLAPVGGTPRERYDRQIETTRARLDRLVRAAPSDWLVIVNSDHGEAFGEDGVHGHGHALHDAELLVPLAMWGPGVRPGRSLAPVALADLGRTVLDQVGLSDVEFPGRSWFVGGRERIVVAGVREDPRLAAVRTAAGAYLPVDPGTPGPPLSISRSTRDELRALGYQDPEEAP